MDMSQFLPSFFAGVAAAVVVGIGSLSIRKVIKSRSTSSPVFDNKTFRGLLVICVGLALVLISVFIQNEVAGHLVGPGIVILVWGVVDYF
jgi:hypothetical protein